MAASSPIMLPVTTDHARVVTLSHLQGDQVDDAPVRYRSGHDGSSQILGY